MKPFDPKVHELVLHFVGDVATPEEADSLAAEIQDAIDDWLADHEPWCYVCDRPRDACACDWLGHPGSAHARQEQPTSTSEESTNDKEEEEQ